jgi:hypothetical protein
MKKILLSVSILCSFTCLSQDTSKIKQIDSLVGVINQSDLIVSNDTIIQNRTELGIFMKIFTTTSFAGNDLLKYVYRTTSTSQENGKTSILNTSSTFFFGGNKLIKVEEFGGYEGKEIKLEWYYSNDKALYFTNKSEKSEARAQLLLTLAESIQRQIHQKK